MTAMIHEQLKEKRYYASPLCVSRRRASKISPAPRYYQGLDSTCNPSAGGAAKSDDAGGDGVSEHALCGGVLIGPSVHFHSRRRLARPCRGVCGVEAYGSASKPSRSATARTCRSIRMVRRFLRSSFVSDVLPVPSSSLDVLVSESDSLVSESSEPGSSRPAAWGCTACTASTASSSSRSKCCAVYRSVRISSSSGCRKVTVFLAGKKTRRAPALLGPAPAETDPERRLEAVSSGELRRMLRMPSGSW